MFGRNTGNLATIRIRQEFVLREFELSGMHCISIIKNAEHASTARARESRDFHVRGTESGPNDV